MIKKITLDYDKDPEKVTDEDLYYYSGKKNLEKVISVEVLANTTKTSLDFLGDTLFNLQKIRLDNSTIANIRDIGCNFSKLKYLSLNKCGITSLNGISTLSRNLEELYLRSNGIKDASDLMGMDNLKIVDLTDNLIEDTANLQFLSCCGSLKTLYMTGNPATKSTTFFADVKKFVPQINVIVKSHSETPNIDTNKNVEALSDKEGKVKNHGISKTKMEESEKEEKLAKEKSDKEKNEKKENEKKEKEKEEKERRERMEKERMEKERIEKERMEKERMERERMEKERMEKERMEKERMEKERMKKERMEKERMEKERIEKEKLKKEREERRRVEKERIEKERMEKERIEKERIEKEKLKKEREERRRVEKERIEKEKRKKEIEERRRIEKERMEKEEKEKRKKEIEERRKIEKENAVIKVKELEIEERKRLEKEKKEKDRQEKRRIENEREMKERKKNEEKDKEEINQLEKKKIEKEKEKEEKRRLAKEKREKEKAERSRIEKEKTENDKLEIMKVNEAKEIEERRKIVKEKCEKEKEEKKRFEKEKEEKELYEKKKEERRRLEKEKRQKEREERKRKEMAVELLENPGDFKKNDTMIKENEDLSNYTYRKKYEFNDNLPSFDELKYRQYKERKSESPKSDPKSFFEEDSRKSDSKNVPDLSKSYHTETPQKEKSQRNKEEKTSSPIGMPSTEYHAEEVAPRYSPSKSIFGPNKIRNDYKASEDKSKAKKETKAFKHSGETRDSKPNRENNEILVKKQPKEPISHKEVENLFKMEEQRLYQKKNPDQIRQRMASTPSELELVRKKGKVVPSFNELNDDHSSHSKKKIRVNTKDDAQYKPISKKKEIDVFDLHSDVEFFHQETHGVNLRRSESSRRIHHDEEADNFKSVKIKKDIDVKRIKRTPSEMEKKEFPRNKVEVREVKEKMESKKSILPPIENISKQSSKTKNLIVDLINDDLSDDPYLPKRSGSRVNSSRLTNALDAAGNKPKTNYMQSPRTRLIARPL